MKIPEDLLHFIWKFQLFNTSNLKTVTGKKIEIIDRGIHNHDSGPDFSAAKIKIGDTRWVGNLEIHVSSSDWHMHKHDTDTAYDNVILHVVYQFNSEALNSKKRKIETLELEELLDEKLLDKYFALHQSDQWIACESYIDQVNNITLEMLMQRMGIERLESKMDTLNQKFRQSNQNWESLMIRLVSRYFGKNKNQLGFDSLIQNTPVKILSKHANDPSIVEAILHGQSGLLPTNSKEEKIIYWRSEYDFYKKKYKLKELNPVVWKFGKMRPHSFPSVKISQLSNLLTYHPALFNEVINTIFLKDLFTIFQVEASSYWTNHFTFGNKTGSKKVKRLGKTSIDILLINAIIPIIFFYGKYNNKQEYQDRAISFLEELQSEKNNVVNKWKSLGVISKSALDSQALLHLKKSYCSPKKCLFCPIGHQVIHRKT